MLYYLKHKESMEQGILQQRREALLDNERIA